MSSPPKPRPPPPPGAAPGRGRAAPGIGRAAPGRGRVAPSVDPVSSTLSHLTLSSSAPSSKQQLSSLSSGSVPGITPPQEGDSSVEEGPTLYRGTAGKELKLATNYLRLSLTSDASGLYEYDVRFDPQVDNRDLRFKLLAKAQDMIGTVKSFDGTKLFLPVQLPQAVSACQVKLDEDPTYTEVKVSFKGKREGGQEVIQHYNILFNKIFRMLKFAQHRRNFYDPCGAHQIKAYNLSVWPGYVTAVDKYEGGLLLQLDVSHRVLRTETAKDAMRALQTGNGAAGFKPECERTLIGATVLTRYNNKSYRIDDILWDQTPKDSFENAQGEKVCFMDYYKNHHNIAIQDPNQPLLLHRIKASKRAEGEANVEKLIALVPELCMMTGLTERMRADFKIMKEVANFTRLVPDARRASMLQLLKRVRESPEASALLENWGLHLAPDPVTLLGRMLPSQKIFFGGNASEIVNAKGDWGRAACSKNVLTPVHLNKWAVVYPTKNEKTVKAFVGTLMQQAAKMGIKMANPRPVGIANDRTETYLATMRDLIEPTVQLIMTVVPVQKSDRYAGIKKLCCLEKPIANQVMLLKTMSNEKRLISVAQKVALQINCKLGGELWACHTPFKGLMVVGIDVFHEKSGKVGSAASVVSSMNDNHSRYYSTVAMQRPGQELLTALTCAFTECLLKYWEINGSFPANVVVFRDGVSDSQMAAVERMEVEQFKATFKMAVLKGKGGSANLPSGYNPGFNFIVVQKRINTRIFGGKMVQGRVSYFNPDAGTIVDHTITRRTFKDFFLVPMSVTQGTVTPTHFVVLHEGGENPLKADQIQGLAYQLTHMYFNWPGTVRVPAPCQYAHKLCDLVGEQLKSPPSIELGHKLFYL